MDLACPKCRSDNTQKLSLVVEGGTLRSTASTFGVGGAGKSVGVMGASTTTSSTSKLAEKHEAPTKTPAIRLGLLIIGIAWVVSLFAGSWAFWLGCLLGAAATIQGWRYNSNDYPREIAEWNAKFLCLRCSEVFTPGSTSNDGLATDAEAAG